MDNSPDRMASTSGADGWKSAWAGPPGFPVKDLASVGIKFESDPAIYLVHIWKGLFPANGL
jgi:hypothetical protein